VKELRIIESRCSGRMDAVRRLRVDYRTYRRWLDAKPSPPPPFVRLALRALAWIAERHADKWRELTSASSRPRERVK